ncbi:transmembrane protein, putative [Pediculus humanus corporis]|uniref:Transmembrane protein, putative n=1 Tax=Pediculus humanus subsp. corporis TaxID=121224 RepID=E0VCZ7_PEDHC|nr:uncharacterized protein Phum_PHUM102720 [Pediculus humanus corporis]EEB11253.1 transmembrane protein, putative [Pediculus humanus corporis]
MNTTLKNSEKKSLWKGPLLAFLSGTFFTLSSAAVKALTTINPMELLVIRSIVQIIFMLIIAIYVKKNLFGPKGYRLMLNIQGLVGGLTLILLFFTFRRLPLGDATTIIFSSPVFVMVLSFIILREPCGFFRALIVALLLLGVILIAKPPFIFQFFYHVEQSYDVLGYSSAVLATIFMALNIVVIRKCKDVHFSIVVLQLSTWSLIFSGILLYILVEFNGDKIVIPQGTNEWLLTSLVSVLGLAGQVLVARALGIEDAGKVAVIRSLDIILAFFLQVTVFGEIPDWMSGLGAAAILLCVTGMTFENQIQNFMDKIP